MNTFLIVLISSLLFFGASAQDEVIMTIDGNSITKSEFLQIYLKNNNHPQYDKASLDEYMELFKRFKLKVAEAEALGYDTIPKLMKELAGYQRQLAQPYLTDSSENESLVREAYERTKQEVRASHILIKLEPDAIPADTLKAYTRLMDLKKRIESGESFEAVAKGKNGSEDPTVKSNGGDLGYFTAFQMVYPFEEAAYTTEIGSVSDPVRTRFGYHIIKVLDKRPARGTIETAHLMIAAKRDAPQDQIDAARNQINEISALLEKGESFEDLVRKYSDDPSTNQKRGVLPAFGTGQTTRMVSEYTEAAFALQNDGDISAPVQTDYGFHIIKRIKREDVPDFKTMRKELENKVSKDTRSSKTQDSFIAKLKKEYNYKRESTKRLKWFENNIDSNFFLGKFKADQLPKNKILFTMDNQKFYQKDFAEYLEKRYRKIRKDEPSTVVEKSYKLWEKEAILNYEETKLASKYPAYKALITEYHDGILLYEIMSDKVWNKAIKDTVGLRSFYEKNKDNYMWEDRLDADVFECNSLENAKSVAELLNVDTLDLTTIVRMVNEPSALNVKHKRNKYEVAKTNYLSDAPVSLKKGVNEIYEYNGKFFVVKVHEKLDASVKQLSEAKGIVTSDYQNLLEKEWIEEISRKHQVEINEDVLYRLGT